MCGKPVCGPLGHESPSEMATKYVELLLDESGDTMLRGPAARFTNGIGRANLQFCSSKQLEAIGVFTGLCDLARDDWTVVKQALSDAPSAVDALFQFVTQTPRLHPDGDNNYTPDEWVFEDGDLTPTPPQTGRAYSRAMEDGPIALASQLLGSRCTKLVAAARGSQFFEGMINRLALLVAFAEVDRMGELPMIALDGLLACDDSLAVWRALKCWPDIDESLEVLAEEGGECAEDMVDAVLDLLDCDEEDAKTWKAAECAKEVCDECGEDSRMLNGMKLKKCAHCCQAKYCSKPCQKTAWSKGHKSVCVKKQSQASGNKVTKASKKSRKKKGKTKQKEDVMDPMSESDECILDSLDQMSVSELKVAIDETNHSLREFENYEEWELIKTTGSKQALIARIRHITSGGGVPDMAAPFLIDQLSLIYQDL